MSFYPQQYDDMRIPDSAVRPGVTAPSLATFLGNIRMYEYAAGKEIEIAAQIPHTWKEGSILHPHCHIVCPNATAGNIVFGMEYTLADVDEVFGAPGAPIESAVTAVPGVAYRHFILELPDIIMTGFKVSAMFCARIYRKSGVAGAYPNAVFMPEFDIHYQMDSFGSNYELHK